MKSAVLEKPATQELVKFVCPAGYNMTLVIESESIKEVQGQAIRVPPHRIHFSKEGHDNDTESGVGFWWGAFVTRNPVEIEFIRNHVLFKKGELPPKPRWNRGEPVNESGGGYSRNIYEIPYDPNASKVGPKQVIRRGDPEEQPEPEPTPPTETTPPPNRARISKRLRRT